MISLSWYLASRYSMHMHMLQEALVYTVIMNSVLVIAQMFNK